MNDLTAEEIQIVTIMRDLKQYEIIEIKLDEAGRTTITVTKKQRYYLTRN